MPVIPDNFMHDRVEKGYITSYFMLKMPGCPSGEVNSSGISHDKPASLFYGPLHTVGNYRMRFRSIGPYDKNDRNVLYFTDRVCHCPCTECGSQTGHRWCVSGTRAVVNIICTHYCAHEFHHYIIALIGRSRTSDPHY